VAGTAYSGEEAIDLARRFLPDLVLMDIGLPGGLDGIEASEILKAELDIPVIFISIHGDKKCLERAKKVEPLGYLHKPFSPEQVAAAIEMAFCKNIKEIEQKHAYDELRQSVKAQSEKLEEAHAQLKSMSEQVAELDQAPDGAAGGRHLSPCREYDIPVDPPVPFSAGKIPAGRRWYRTGRGNRDSRGHSEELRHAVYVQTPARIS